MNMKLSLVLVAFLAASTVSANPLAIKLRELYVSNEGLSTGLIGQIDAIRQNAQLSTEQKQEQIGEAVVNVLIQLRQGLEDEHFVALKALLGERLRSVAPRLAQQATETDKTSQQLVEEELNFVREALKSFAASTQRVNTAIGDRLKAAIVDTVGEDRINRAQNAVQERVARVQELAESHVETAVEFAKDKFGGLLKRTKKVLANKEESSEQKETEQKEETQEEAKEQQEQA
jgi:hypothetical protein